MDANAKPGRVTVILLPNRMIREQCIAPTVLFIYHRPGLPPGLGEIILGTKVILRLPTYISLRDFTVG